MKILFENEIAIVACLKNESPYVDEWLEYHHAIGIDKFYLYDNDSEDRSELLKILAPWIEREIVEYIEFPGEYAQLPAYNDAILKHRFDCRYLAFIDLDEFIVPKKSQDLLNLIDSIFSTKTESNMRVGGIGINWRCFGSNGQDKRLAGGVIERFIKRAPDEFPRNRVIKTIANPRCVKLISRPHDATYFMNCICVNEQGKQISEFENPDNTVENLQINHYFTKSREEFKSKISRGRADCYLRYGEQVFESYQNDIVEDKVALDLVNNHIFRWKIPRNDELTILDLESMLATDLNFETLLTCFHRARTLKDQSRRDEFTKKSLEKFLHAQPQHISDNYLLFESLPEIIAIKSTFTRPIFNVATQILKQLESIMRQNLVWNEMVYLRHKRELIESFL